MGMEAIKEEEPHEQLQLPVPPGELGGRIERRPCIQVSVIT